jgi:glutathione S-transferase
MKRSTIPLLDLLRETVIECASRSAREPMKLLDGGSEPNPRRVRIFLAEKGITVPIAPAGRAELEDKSAALAALDPGQRVPTLVLDDGTLITESIAICRYFEAIRPDPPLFGRGGKEIALVEMWNRRVELTLFAAVTAADRRLPSLEGMEHEVAQTREAHYPRSLEFLDFLDHELQGHLFIVGNHYTVVDITTLVSIDFMKSAQPAILPEFANIRRWHGQVSARASAAA